MSSVSPPAFVGRRRELVVLARALASFPAVVLVEGEAGIGKSRLLRELVASTADRGQRFVAATCPPLREPYTLGPVVDAMRQATERVAGLGLSDLAGALRPLFPEWAAELPAAPEPAEDARAARHRLFRALTELLGCLDVNVLVVEDVHWADEATLEFLLFLATCQPQPVSVVVTYRPEDIPPDSLLLRLSSRLPGNATRTRLVLGPLDVDETAGLVASMLDGEQLSADFAAFVHERTDGVPLAVEESVRLMDDRADVARYGGGWVRRNLDDIDVPPTVRDAVLERSRRLSRDAQAVLQATAVLDHPADETTLTVVSALPTDRAATGLAEALDCGLVEEDARGSVTFRHGLAARAVYEAIPGPRRRAMHRRAGRTLETTAPAPAARLARHFREAGDTAAWARYAEQAADAAILAGDGFRATTLIHTLLSTAKLPATTVEPLVTKIPAGTQPSVTWAGDVVRALRAALESGELEAEQEAMTRFRLAFVFELMDDYDSCRRELELAIPHLRPGSVELLSAMLVLGWPMGLSCPGRVHRDWLRRAADAEGSVSPADQAEVSVQRGMALLLLDEAEGWRVADAVPNDCSTPMGRRDVVFRDVNLGELARRWGRYAEARSRLGNALELAERYDYPQYRDSISDSQVHLDWLTGEWAGLAERAGDLAASVDTLPMSRLRASLVTALLQAAEGMYADAEALLTRVLAQMRDLGAVESFVEPAAALARLYLDTDRVEEALAVTEEPIGVVELKETWLWATDLAPARVEALIAVGRIDDAAELAAEFADGVHGREAPAAEAAVVWCDGILVAGHGAREDAAAVFGRAADAWETLPRPYDALLARERQAHCLLDAGQRESGVSLLACLHTGLADLGARAAAERVLDALNAHGTEPVRPRRRGRPGYGDRLSPRELQVVQLIVEGRTNQQIADALVLSRLTVNSHVRSAMRKLRVSSRTALAVNAVELRLDG